MRAAATAAQPKISITAIAKLLGISPGTLDNHVPTHMS
jgi:transposase-like protein